MVWSESEHPRDKNGQFTDGNGTSAKSGSIRVGEGQPAEWESDKVKLPNIEIGRSVGAKAFNYRVMDLKTGECFYFAEGTRLQDVEVFCGKGTKNTYRNAEKYAKKHGGKIEEWQHAKAIGILDTPEGYRKAEVHWSQHSEYGKHDFFIKEWID